MVRGAVPLYPELEPLLVRLASALVALDEAEAALAAAAQRLAANPGAPSAMRAMARCDVLQRRARLHAELARRALSLGRADLLDDQRRVPAAFRRRRQGSGPAVEVLGAPVQRAARADVRDRAAS
jgi:hypothetical protein